MKLPQFLKGMMLGADERPRAPQALLYVCPQGSPVHCSSIEQAQSVAQDFAGQNPGRTVAVYQLVGYAFRPVEAPDFVPASSDEAKELIDCAPASPEMADEPYDEDLATGGFDVSHRIGMSTEQIETLNRLRAARRREG